MNMQRRWNPKAAFSLALAAGFIQVCAGIAMYIAGVYFTSWSMAVSVLVLVACIVFGIRWYGARYRGALTFSHAFGLGVLISVATGIIYGLYNWISITWFYPDFLSDFVRARIAAGAPPRADESISAIGIAISNCIRLAIIGSVLSLPAAFFLRGSETSPSVEAVTQH